MSNLSIYETRWINLVFENRNQAYGAYQLRKESSRRTVMAFFSSLLFITALTVLFSFSNRFSTTTPAETPPITIDEPLVVVQYEVKPIQPITPPSTSQATAPIETSVLLPMVVSKTPDTEAVIPTNREIIENSNSTITNEGGTGTGIGNNSSGNSIAPAVPAIDDKEIINSGQLDKLPEFPGGIKNFYNYVGKNFESPEIEEANTFKVYVNFVVEKDGSMTDIKILRDPGYGLGKEAIRVLKSLKTKWTPGMVNSKPVRTSYSLPISIGMH